MVDTDDKLGLPVRSEADTYDGYVLIKIRGNPTGTGAATNEAIVDNDKNVHIEVHGNKPSGADVVLRLSEMGAVNPDGDYDAAINTKPASIGLVIHDRNASPNETHQNLRITGVPSSVDTDVKAMDVAIRDEAGNPFTNANPMPAHDLATKTSVDSVLAQLQSGGIILGTENGVISGTARPFVNNRRLQILAALDRQQAITTADFGTKDQRITQIDYTAPSIGSGPGYTARKVVSYTLVGTRYRRDSINWVLI